MGLIAKKFEGDSNVLEEHLRHWFRFDHLSPLQGISLLVGVVPDGNVELALRNWEPDPGDSYHALYVGVCLLNGEEICVWPESGDLEVPPWEWFESTEKRSFFESAAMRLYPFSQALNRLYGYWQSGNHPAVTPLSYFVQWAISKDIAPPWVTIANEIGVCAVTNQREINQDFGRTHISDKLAILNQSAQRFWANADQHDRSTHPTNNTVVQWLVQRGYTQTLAEKAATIIRPDWAPTGRKPEE